jgi:PIN domain nuclease of toxin-antitoxin system
MTSLLFDSHALFWFLHGDRQLSVRARAAIEAPDTVNVASAVSAWEFANKFRLGKWPEIGIVANSFVETMHAQGIEILAVTAEHAQLAGLLAGDHRDPFDRMLAAQSQIEAMPLITADPVFKAFGTKVVW